MRHDFKENCSLINPRHLSDCLLVINLTEVFKNPIKSHYSADYWHRVADVAQCFSRKWHWGPNRRRLDRTIGKRQPYPVPCNTTLYTIPLDIRHLTTTSYRKNKVLVRTSFRNNEWLVYFPIQFKYSHLNVVGGWLKSPKWMAGRWQEKERGRWMVFMRFHNSTTVQYN